MIDGYSLYDLIANGSGQFHGFACFPAGKNKVRLLSGACVLVLRSRVPCAPALSPHSYGSIAAAPPMARPGRSNARTAFYEVVQALWGDLCWLEAQPGFWSCAVPPVSRAALCL